MLVYLLGLVQLVRGASYVVGSPQPFSPVVRMSALRSAAEMPRTSPISCIATRPDEVSAKTVSEAVGDMAQASRTAALVDQVSSNTPATSSTPKKAATKGKSEAAMTERKVVTHGQPLVIGLSHKTATVDVREKLSIKEADWNAAAAKLCEYDSITEAAVLSTCNRFELYLAAEDHFAATRDALAFLRERSQLTDMELRPNLFMLQNEDAVYHLLRVSAGLDSLVVGEGQILSQARRPFLLVLPSHIILWLPSHEGRTLGYLAVDVVRGLCFNELPLTPSPRYIFAQVKACHSHAISTDTEEDAIPGSAGKVLGRLLNTAVMSGKYVRSETEIAKGAPRPDTLNRFVTVLAQSPATTIR
eukprot:57849-Pleurochrysis_carterae.AAC.1